MRLYDRRMLTPGKPSSPSSFGGRSISWVSCFVPPHVYSPRPPFYCQAGRCHTVTSVAFSHTGRELVASYCGDSIYSYLVADHSYEPLWGSRLTFLSSSTALTFTCPLSCCLFSLSGWNELLAFLTEN